MRPGSIGWWAGKVRQTRRYLTARVSPPERSEVTRWLTPAELEIFDGMHIADRRHGLDVAATLRADGVSDREVLVAGLLHDAGKGNTSILPRAVYALSAAYGAWISRAVGSLPGLAASLARLEAHAETSARMAAAAGCSERTVELIRWQDAPRDPEAGERLRVADEAN